MQKDITQGGIHGGYWGNPKYLSLTVLDFTSHSRTHVYQA